VGAQQEKVTFAKAPSNIRMAFNSLFNVLLVFISGFGFVFTFVTVGRVMSFLSIIPSPKVEAVQIDGNLFKKHNVLNVHKVVFSTQWR
jgi:hypothetical protein